MYKLLFYSLLLIGLGACNTSENKEVSKDNQSNLKASSKLIKRNLFEAVSAEKSNINFSNSLKADVSSIENLFDFDYFYNGAGVGVADINNDGLKDIFFTGNQVKNKLYLNKGNLVFEDISEKANINNGKFWSNGVTFADVNNDGWIDIYISQGGPKRAGERKNLLFINQKNLSFKESAQDYGLADQGMSTQAVFFDYDKDGDLDCFVSNENEFFGLAPTTFYKVVNNSEANLLKSSGHLYRNNNGKFEDITKAAGLLSPSFGLGVSVSDINNDGWLDLYVANDYYVPDALYINNKDGSFSNRIKEQIKQVSFYGMGVDIADINNDTHQDIFVLDMASSDHVRSKTLMASMNEARFSLLVDKLDMPYQYMYNSMQLNMGNNTFNNIAQLAKLSKTDWSWAGLMVDLDFDGFKDIYVTNGYRRYALDNDLKNQVTDVQRAFKGKVPLDAKQKLYDAMPSEKLANILFHNKTNLSFKNESYNWGLSEPSYSNGAAYADLDNDGDLELLVNNIDAKAFLYKNTTVEKQLGNYLKVKTQGRISETFAKVYAISEGNTQFVETKRVKGYLSSADEAAYFGLGKATIIDTLRVVWLSGKSEEKYNVAVNQEIVFFEKDAETSRGFSQRKIHYTFKKENSLGLNFSHQENNYNDFSAEVLLPYKQSTLGPSLAKGDINGDGKDDFYIGGAFGQAGQLFVQTETGFSKQASKALENDRQHEDMEALFFDVEGDGDMDLYVVSGGNEYKAQDKVYADRLYINDGKGNFSKSTDKAISTNKQSGKTVAAIDFDKDGDLDLIIGNRIVPQHYPTAASSRLLENKNGIFTEVTHKIAPELRRFGMINKIIATDFNNDGWQDFIAVGEWTHIGVFLNDKGVFKDISEKSELNKQKGWWFSIGETDVNNDGLKDYVIGNVGNNIKFKASQSEPFKVFADDFDGNGTFDVVLSYNYNGKAVPARGKECSTQQMPFISQKFETYDAFANASLYDIYGDKLNRSYNKEVTQFKSVVLVNKGDGDFDIQELPSLAQAAPVLDMVFKDLNNDGIDDVILIGNIYNTEVETPRLDMGTGTVLISENESYRALSALESNFYISGNTKALEIIEHKGLNKTIYPGNTKK